MVYTIKPETLQEIADAIRDAEDRTESYKIPTENFAEEIRKLDPPLSQYTEKFDNGYYGLRAAKCATTYFEARVCGFDKFAYHTNNIFSQVAGRTPSVRLGEYGRIDCSVFVGLCLRGIPYDKSPYALHKGADDTWTPATELEAMYGAEGWEHPELDTQQAGEFNDLGIADHSSIRFAADIGRYFSKYGYVLYDKARDGTITSHNGLGLEPGDLVFWDTSDNINVDGRFKSISHIGLVGENASFYYEATGTEGTTGQEVIKFTQFSNSGSHPTSSMVLAVRPDYRPSKPKEQTPIGVNLLEFPWTYSRQASYTTNGLTLNQTNKNTIVVNGTSTAATTIGLKSYANSDDHITLSAGTYQLSGIPSGFSGTGFALQVRDAAGTDFSTPIRYPSGSSATSTFTLTQQTDVTVRLYCGNNRTISNASVVPTLIRTV